VVKTKIQDLAAEFGISSDQLMTLLRDMGVSARSAAANLEDTQVSAVRVRWEREKRRQAEAPVVKKTTRKKAAAKVAPEPEPEPVDASRPARRRRTAAEVAEVQATADAEAARIAAEEAFTMERDTPVFAPDPVTPQVPMPTIEERARAIFRDLPPLPADAETETAPVEAAASDSESRPAHSAPAAPAEHSTTPAGPPVRKPFVPPRVQRPAPGAAGPKPVFSSSNPGAQRSGQSRGPSSGPGGQHRPGGPGGRPGGPGGRPGGPGRSGGPGGPGGPGGARPGAPGSAPARNFGPDAQKGGGRRKGKKGRRPDVDQEAVRENVLKTLAGMRGPAGRKRRSDEPSYRELLAGRAAEEAEREKTRIRVNEFISVAELAGIMKVPAIQIVQFAFKELGLMVTVNQRLDFDQIELISSAFGFEAVRESEYMAEADAPVEVEDEGPKTPRPPVVTIMGHVDHGKTSLLDHIRKANVVAGEAGGITQHIGAYHVSLPAGKSITFLDTPGHEAFTAMRARGAQVTDIVVLVVAADDQVMPQTIEAISHARNAGVPLIVAINKIDLPAANVAKVKQDLLAQQVVLEEFGGQVLSAEISAKKGTGIERLLEQVLLQSEILDLKANAEASMHGTVLEATLDPGKGPLATVLVQKGTLEVGANFICGRFSGRVRALFDERGKQTKVAGPSIPVQVLGFEGVPAAGDSFVVVADALAAREIAQKRQRLDREAQNRRTVRGGTLEDISRALKAGEVSALPIIIKADQGGPAEALADALAQLSTGEVRVEVVHRGVGAITESDVLLAKASGAIILGFHVRPDANARATAEREQVDVRTYRVIYEAVDDVKKGLEGLLKPEEKETVLGEAEVLQVFKISKVGAIAGCMVRQGIMQRTAKARVVRDGTVVYVGGLSSLKRFKDDVKEVRDGLECGIGIENFNDLKVGDRIESFRVEAVKRTLESSATGGA
jgi:translation initiation factor IF-2